MVIYVKEWNGRKRTVGSQVNAWEPGVATLPDLTQMESVTYVNEIDVRKLAVGQPGAFSYLFSGFFRADISGDQRFAADRAVHPASGADAALCVDGGAGVGTWMRTSFFHCGKWRGSAVSQARGKRAQAIHNWVVHNGFAGMLVAALLPPPTPFKIFVVAAFLGETKSLIERFFSVQLPGDVTGEMRVMVRVSCCEYQIRWDRTV